MKKFYFTFGSAHDFANEYQPIFAKSIEEAERKMFDLYGKRWAHGYDYCRWMRSKSMGFFKDLKPLKIVYSF